MPTQKELEALSRKAKEAKDALREAIMDKKNLPPIKVRPSAPENARLSKEDFVKKYRKEDDEEAEVRAEIAKRRAEKEEAEAKEAVAKRKEKEETPEPEKKKYTRKKKVE